MKRIVLVTLAAALAAACGGSDTASTTPTSPAAQTALANGAAGAVSGDGTTTTATTATVIIGTISGLSGACPAVAFTLESKTIKTDASTGYGDGKCADLKNGAKVGVQGSAQADGSILAKQIRVAPPTPVYATVTGTVSGLGGACPAIAFTIESKRVKTDASTSFGDKTCADVKNDGKVSAAGVVQADGSILAKLVKVIPPPPPPPVMVSGTISGLSGTCPAVTFTVAGKKVVTSAATTWGDLKCADLKGDSKVIAIGPAQADGSVLATGVRIAPPPPVYLTVTGAVSALSGACPAITFSVDSKKVVTTANTKFGDKTCADVKTDVKVSVAGTVQADGSILALQLKFVPVVTVVAPAFIGTVTAISGTCPAITITAGTRVAVTSSATVFDGKACADVKVGMKVGVFGSAAAGSTTIAATRVVVR